MSVAEALEPSLEIPLVFEDLTDEECFLFCILEDKSGIDQAEFLWVDESTEDSCWRAWSFQWLWWRAEDALQIDQCARSVGKSTSIVARACAFPLRYPGEEMIISAPEFVHLDPVTSLVERQLLAVRLYREMLPSKRLSITHRPFKVQFANGSRIMGRIPQRDGKGVKGLHPVCLELDEAQDFPHPGWVEITETLKRGSVGAMWRAHGVTRGIRDDFYERTQDAPDNPWKVHRYSAQWRPTWTDEEREEKISQYGSRDDPDYRRNVLGLHGDRSNPLFVLTRLMKCWIGNTPVRLADSNGSAGLSIPIQEVEKGDRVVTAIGVGEVSDKRIVYANRVVRFTLDSGERLICSPEHPMLTHRGWSYADQLRPGDELWREPDVRDVRRAVPLEAEEAVLLATLLGEVGWDDLSRLGYAAADIEALRSLRDAVLQTVEGSPVLLAHLRQQSVGGSADEIAGQAMRVLRTGLQAGSGGSSLLHDSLRLRRSSEGASGPGSESAHATGRSGRLTRRAVPVVAGVGRKLGGVVRQLLGESVRRAWRGADLLHDRRGRPAADDRCGSGWDGSSPHAAPVDGPAPRRLAGRPRVVRVEVLERGDPDFDRLSGGADQVPLYDLTVTGHPSFAVGEQGVLTHNCVDSDETSDYNQNEYFPVSVKAETMSYYGQDIEEFLDFPERHKKYLGIGKKAKAFFWIGMDVGYTTDPSEILVFVEYRKRALETEPSKLKLVARIHLERIGHQDQVKAILKVIDFYRPQAFAMDKTGLGLPLFQDIQQTVAADPAKRYILDVIKGYNFSERIVVDFDESVEISEFANQEEVTRTTGIRRPVIEYSSDVLRDLVDAARLELPWDAEVLKQFQGSTWTQVRGMDQYGRKQYSQHNCHTLDAARMAMLGFMQHKMEEVLRSHEMPPVLDSFISFD
jgi:hypothetical protein